MAEMYLSITSFAVRPVSDLVCSTFTFALRVSILSFVFRVLLEMLSDNVEAKILVTNKSTGRRYFIIVSSFKIILLPNHPGEQQFVSQPVLWADRALSLYYHKLQQ